MIEYKVLKEVINQSNKQNSAYIDEERKNLKFTFRDNMGSGSILLHTLKIRKLLIEKYKIEKEIDDFVNSYINSPDLDVLFRLSKLNEDDNKSIGKLMIFYKVLNIVAISLQLLFPIVAMYCFYVVFTIFPFLQKHQYLSFFIWITIGLILEGLIIWISRIIFDRKKIISEFYNECKNYPALYKYEIRNIKEF
jgi:hypothetical protein